MSSSPEVAPASVPHGAALTKDDVERLIKNIIVERGFGCSLLSVCGASNGWTVIVRAETGNLVRFALPTHRAVAARVTIVEILEAEL
jgi:hypothetical protein